MNEVQCDSYGCLAAILLQRTKIGMKMRYDAFVSVQEMITLRAAMYFKSNLEGRNYIGELLFDHEKETLELKVRGCHSGCQPQLLSL